MAVIAEGISVIIKASSITSKYPGGWKSFKDAVPNSTLCADSEIVRVGFKSPEDVESFVREMEKCGLAYLHEGKAEDLVVVDQIKGPMVVCDWIDFVKIDWQKDPSRKITACRIVGSKIDQCRANPTDPGESNCLSISNPTDLGFSMPAPAMTFKDQSTSDRDPYSLQGRRPPGSVGVAAASSEAIFCLSASGSRALRLSR